MTADAPRVRIAVPERCHATCPHCGRRCDSAVKTALLLKIWRWFAWTKPSKKTGKTAFASFYDGGWSNRQIMAEIKEVLGDDIHCGYRNPKAQ